MANIRGSYQSGDQATVIVIPDTINTNTTRQQPELQNRKDLVDFGRTMKTTFKNLLFEDEGEKLLSRIADARPKVIGGRKGYLVRREGEVLIVYLTETERQFNKYLPLYSLHSLQRQEQRRIRFIISHSKQ